jgi:hypothetical protein
MLRCIFPLSLFPQTCIMRRIHIQSKGETRERHGERERERHTHTHTHARTRTHIYIYIHTYIHNWKVNGAPRKQAWSPRPGKRTLPKISPGSRIPSL